MNEAELNRILTATQAHPAPYSSLNLLASLISQIPKGSGYTIVV